MRRKKVIFFLVVILSFNIFTGAKADEISDAQKKLKDSENSITEQKKKLNEINKNKNEVGTDINKLDEQLNDISKRMANLNSQISSLDSEINEAEKSIKEHEEKLEKESELLGKRLKALYTAGGTGYIDILFDSGSFSEFYRRADSIKRIVTYDKELEESILKSKRIVEDKKKEAEGKKSKVIALKSEVETQQREIEKNSNEKKNLMASLEKDKASYEKMIAQEQRESDEIQQQIREAQKRLEEEKNKGQSGSGGQGSNNGSTNNKMYCITGRAYPITSPYGWRVHPILGYKRLHSGIDIGVFYGTPIYALKDGIVSTSESMSGYGNVVMITHGDITSLYAHNSKLLVSKGQFVKGGQLIAYSGSSGLSSGPHLHFEIRTNSGTVNPISYYIR